MKISLGSPMERHREGQLREHRLGECRFHRLRERRFRECRFNDRSGMSPVAWIGIALLFVAIHPVAIHAAQQQSQPLSKEQPKAASSPAAAYAQEKKPQEPPEPPKPAQDAPSDTKPTGSPVELNANFSGFTGSKNIGFGVGATWHLYRENDLDLGLDATVNQFLLQRSPRIYDGGAVTQALIGIRAGFGDGDLGGYYVKARPGFVTFSDAIQSASLTPSGSLTGLRTGRLTLPALDLGFSFDEGIAWKDVEKGDHWSTRFDLSDLMIFQPARSKFGLSGEVVNHFQYAVVVQYRF
ncbi:MAG TPA: hypothetical protein VKZ53_26065 [Candidatus Angelobacter sp.]|nr:hypothetical protein [Candidatus Angelobacter sp.]